VPRLAACAVAWAAGLVPLVLPSELLVGRSRLALCALAWAAVLGAPAARPSGAAASPGAPGPALRAAASTAFALPPLSAALALDGAAGAAGAGPLDALPLLGIGLVLIGLLALAAEVAARGDGRAHALAWALCVAGAPLLRAALAWGADAEPPAWLARLAAASPLAWFYAAAQRGAAAGPWAGAPSSWLAVGVAALLLAAAAWRPGTAAR
jgi:hypothetical protein